MTGMTAFRQPVLEQDDVLGDPLGAGYAHVIGVQHLHHVRVDEPGVVACNHQGERRRRQDDVGPARPSGHRKQAGPVGQVVLKHAGQPEDRQGNGDQGYDEHRPVDGPAAGTSP